MTALSAELSSFITGLDSPAPDAPCGPDCGCHSAAPPSQPGATTLAMFPGIGPDLACSLDRDAQAGRLAEWQALAGQATERTPIDGGIRLTYANANLRAMTDLVAREQGCCSFLSFVIAVTPDATTVDISGPSDARPIIEALA